MRFRKKIRGDELTDYLMTGGVARRSDWPAW